MARLTQRSWDELRTRGAQEVAKRLDALRSSVGARLGGDLVEYHSAPGGQFFFSPVEGRHIARQLHALLPQQADQVIENAERICSHHFDLLGYRNIDYGPEIDWHRDAIHGRSAPRKVWFKVPYLDFSVVGDAKVIWELNRHQHLVTLAKAYCLSGESSFVFELLRQWYHWQRENSYPIGINWASSLEVAFRSLSWLWILHLLIDCPLLPPTFHSDVRRALAVNGRHIARYLSTYFSPNTHLLGEGVGLFFIGTLCPQFRQAPRWRELGWQILMREAQRQVRADGMHFEQSTYYHVYALDFFLHARTLAVRNRIPIPDQFDQTLDKMLNVLCVLSQAGPPPLLGDTDGGRVFDPARNHAEHLLDPLSTGALIFERPEYKCAAGGLREETLWLLGPTAAAEFEQLPAEEHPPCSVQLESSGIHVLADAQPVRRQLTIDAGPQGALRAGHGHADALSIQLSVNGRECLIDSGTLCYVGSGGERDLFRGTAAHNTLRVDEQDQARPAGPFGWDLLPRSHIDRWVSAPSFDLFAASHTGYCRLARPVVHQRWVFDLKSQFMLIRDVVVGTGSHRFEISWHFAPGFTVHKVESSRAILAERGDERLVFVPVASHLWSADIIRQVMAPVYGREDPYSVLRFTACAPAPIECAGLLLLGPAHGATQQLSRLTDSSEPAHVHGYRYRCDTGEHYFFFAGTNGEWRLEAWESDARFVYCGLDGAGGKRDWVMCSGSYVRMNGEKVIRLDDSVVALRMQN